MFFRLQATKSKKRIFIISHYSAPAKGCKTGGYGDSCFFQLFSDWKLKLLLWLQCKVEFPWLAQTATAVQPWWYGTRAAVEAYAKWGVAFLMNTCFDHLPEPLAVDQQDISPICSNVLDFPATILTYRLILMNWSNRSFPVSRHRLIRLHRTQSFQKKKSQMSNLCY